MADKKEIKGFEQKTVEVAGVEYTLQKLPLRKAMELRQKWDAPHLSNGVDNIIACDQCFEHVVVNPRVKLDDFDYFDDAIELTNECIDFLFSGKSSK